jgi:hypothetical protein
MGAGASPTPRPGPPSLVRQLRGLTWLAGSGEGRIGCTRTVKLGPRAISAALRCATRAKVQTHYPFRDRSNYLQVAGRPSKRAGDDPKPDGMTL